MGDACTVAATTGALCDSVVVDAETGGPAALHRVGCPASAADGAVEVRVERYVCDLGVTVYRCTLSWAPGGWQVDDCDVVAES